MACTTIDDLPLEVEAPPPSAAPSAAEKVTPPPPPEVEAPPSSTAAHLGRDDAIIAKGLRAYGKLIGRHPIPWMAVTFLVELAIICGGWAPRLFGDKDLTSPLSSEQQWSVGGGKQEKTINTFKEQIGDKHVWGDKFSNTMFVPKGDPEADIVTRDAFEEIFTLYRKHYDLSVTVKGKEYGFLDLCKRGNFVDFPPDIFPDGHPFNQTGTPKFPCVTISPISCFQEELDMVSPVWKMLDGMGAVSTPAIDGGFGMLNYSGRPSFRSMTDKQIKKTISAMIKPENMPNVGQSTGCFAYSPILTYYINIWGGMLEWGGADGTELLKAGGIRALFYTDGAARIAYRMSESRKDHAVVEDIEEALKLMSDKWHATVREFNKDSKYVETVNLKDWYYIVTELDEEVNQMQWSYFIVGGAIMMCYCAFALVSYRHPMASRANLGFTGLFMILVSEMTSFAAFFLFGLYLNPPMIIGMPLLALGLGMDDMFVLIRYFSNLGVEFIQVHNASDIIGEVLAQAGAGTTLTSVCNFLTFGVGMFLPIPAMSDFCVGAAFIAFFNYFTMVNLFMPITVMEIARIKKMQPDPHIFTFFCHKKIIAHAEETGRRSVAATSAENFSGGLEKAFVKFLQQKYAPFVMNIPVRIATFFVAAGLVVLTMYFIINKELGYSPQDLFESGSMEERSMELSFTTFSLFPALLMFDGVDVANKQKEMLLVYKDVMASEWHEPFIIPPYITMMSLTGYPEYRDGGLPNCLHPLVGGMISCDTTWQDPAYAPLGLVPASNFSQVFKDWRQMPLNFEGKLYGWEKNGFYFADVADVNQFVYDSQGVVTLSFFQFFQVFPYKKGRNNEQLFVDSIKDMHKAIDKSPLRDQVSVYGDITNFWEVFLELDSYLHLLIGIGSAIIFVVTLVIFSMDVVVAFITAISCAMIVLEVYGISCAVLNFNIFIAAFVLMGMGMAVEFTAHFAAAFSMGHGSATERMGEAMVHTFPAIIEGSISTICGISPLCFHTKLFVVKYLFGIVAAVVVIGTFNGFFIMPGLVALMSPVISCVDKMRGQKS